MSEGKNSTVGSCRDYIDNILLLGTNSSCKCLVGNKIIGFNYFQPKHTTNEEVSLEIKVKWVTVINIQEPLYQSKDKIQKYVESSSSYMILLVLQHSQNSQRDVEILKTFQKIFGEKTLENVIIVVVSSKDDESAWPKNRTDENLERFHCQFVRNVCKFNNNITRSDLIQQLMKCWNRVPEMPVSTYESRSHSDTFGVCSGLQDNISGYKSGQHRPKQDCDYLCEDKMKVENSVEWSGQVKENQNRGEERYSDNRRDHAPVINKDTITIVLLGQTGSGKSATGNTILRKQHFKSFASSMPVTQKCKMAEESICGIKIRVIDTPDFFDEDLTNQQEQIKRCKDLAQPQPDVYLLVMGLGRFTDGEKEIVHNIQRVFGEDIIQETIILFTGKEKLRGKTLSDYVKNTNPQLQELIRTCGSRCHAFNNNDHNDLQVESLLEIILEMKRKNGNIDIKEHYPSFKESQKKDCSIQ